MQSDSEAIIEELRANIGPDRRAVFVSGNFNVVHPGHLRLLRFAADCGDYLVVGVNDQVGNETIVPGPLRLENVRSIGIVDYAFRLNDPPEDFIKKLQPAFVVMGKEHESKLNAEKMAVDSYGGQLLYSSGDVVFSSLDLLRREFIEFTPSTIAKPQDFPKRHAFEIGALKNIMRRFSGLSVLVIGDAIIDEYIACDALGMSQEDPSIVVTPILSERFIGGAGIVASHASRLGANTKLISVGGHDATADMARDLLLSYGVHTTLLKDDSRPTTLKQRFRAGGKTLLRVSHLKQHFIDKILQEKIIAEVKAAANNCNLIIFSDFNYGVLPQSLVDEIVAIGTRNNIPMVADSQSSSQVGDVSRFQNMMLLKPTEREARLALRDFNSGLVVLSEALRRKANARHVVLTLGSEGMLIHTPSKIEALWITDQLPAFNKVPRDTAGAGDSFLVMCSLALALGVDIWQSAYLGSIAAACQVSRIGNVPLAVADIEMEIDL